LISDFNEINLNFHADKWLEENYGCEFFHGGGGFLNSSCPFEDHNDSSPSFGINMEKGFFKCFGCGREGSLIKLVSLILELNFFQAVNVIAVYENINLDNLDTITIKSEKFKKVIADKDSEITKNKRLLRKLTIKIKKILLKDFDKADKMFQQLDDYIRENNYTAIREMLNGIA
jgi:hypothetical protein